MVVDLVRYEKRVRTSDGDTITLYPLDIFLSFFLIMSIRTAQLNSKESQKESGSLILTNYKPFATFETKTTGGFMPFTIEMYSRCRLYNIGYPEIIELNYANKGISLNTADLRMFEADFDVYK
jgi:hypothetical protein